MCASCCCFPFIAALPAILMAAIASITLDKGLDRWFAERTEAIIDTSRAVPRPMCRSTAGCLRSICIGIAGEFNRVTPDIEANTAAIASYLSNQARLRGLSAAQLMRRTQRDRAGRDHKQLQSVRRPPERIFEEAQGGQPALIAPGTTTSSAARHQADRFPDLTLSGAPDRCARDPLLAPYGGNAGIPQLQNRFGVSGLAILFSRRALVVLLSASGSASASPSLSRHPRLIGAAEQVSPATSTFTFRPGRRRHRSLASTFNTMTGS
jgi:two-component system nitrogen regulation sensor histidine kinase NtrY